MQRAHFAAICVTLPLWQGPAVAAIGVKVDAKANIYTAGRSTPFNGVLPQYVRFPAGPNKTLQILETTGTVGCTQTDPSHNAEGGVCLGRTQTNINSFQGISGIRHDTKTLFLVGVFLDDSTPNDPAPAIVNFTTNDNATAYSPLLRQTFFIGDGKTTAGVVQQFHIPATATRLFLGFADGAYVVGYPGAYEDNAGSITAQIDLGSSSFCSQSVEPDTIPMAGAGGPGAVFVYAQGGCAWTAASNTNWITITARDAARVDFAVTPNTGATRTGTMTVAGLTVTVTQTSGTVACTYTISPSSASVAATGGTGEVSVSVIPGCTWTASSTANWISITSGSSGNGNGAVHYSAAANTGASRTGAITIAGRTFTLTQAGTACTYAISPSSAAFAPFGGDIDVNVTTTAGCRWTAVSNAAWISVPSGSEGTGNGRTVLRVAANTGASRTGTATIAGSTFTVVQGAGACAYSIAPTSASIGANASRGEVRVTTGASCTWTASSAVSWIEIASGLSGSGAGSVTYAVAVNPAEMQRVGALTIAGQRFTLTQAAAPTAGREPPEIASGGVINDADLTPAFAPGSIIRIFGEYLYRGFHDFSDPPYPDTWDGLSVEIVDGAIVTKAPLILVSQWEIVAQLPYEIPAKQVQLRVRNSTGVSNAVAMDVWTSAPRIYTASGGKGAAFALNTAGQVTDASPARGGEPVMIFAEGLGAVRPAVRSGYPAGAEPFHDVVEQVAVQVGGKTADFRYAYLWPGLVGIYIVEFLLPADIPNGTPALSVTMGMRTSQSGVTLRTSSAWRDAATLTLNPQGGTASGGGVSITAAAGVFTERVEVRVQSGAGGIRLSGLPRGTEGPLRLALESSTTLDPTSTYVRMRTEEATPREAWFRGDVSGNRVTITLPARTGDAGKQARAADEAENLILELMLGIRTTTSSSGQFEILTSEGIGGAPTRAVLDSLDAAIRFARQQGLDTLVDRLLRSGPLLVQLEQSEKAPRAGLVEYFNDWSTGYLAEDASLDAGVLFDSPWNDGEYSIKVILKNYAECQPNFLAGHMVLHAVLNMAEPGGKPATGWLWMQEAVAVLYEEEAEQTSHINIRFPSYYSGLDAMPDDALDVGRGASAFLIMLRSGAGGQALVSNLFRNFRLLYDRPVLALRAALTPSGLETEWVKFIDRWSSRFNDYHFERFVPYQLQAGIGTTEQAVALYDLSAELAMFKFPSNLPADTRIFVELSSADEKPVAIVRRLEPRVSADKWEIPANSGRREIRDVNWKNGEMIFITVVQPRSGERNRTTSATIRVILESETKPPSAATPFTQAPDRVLFGFGVPMLCNGQRCGSGSYDTKQSQVSLQYIPGQMRFELNSDAVKVVARFEEWTRLASFTISYTRPLYQATERIDVELKNIPCVWNSDSHASCSVSRAAFNRADYVTRYELVQMDLAGNVVGRGTPDWNLVTQAFPIDLLFKHRTDP
ncbi:MAG: hypothetical protein JST93_03235 [Acidobacteria bacterium]|nr:hypothetical protein [Acidobacteriota bacterium]